jgi:hypothetical protein
MKKNQTSTIPEKNYNLSGTSIYDGSYSTTNGILFSSADDPKKNIALRLEKNALYVIMPGKNNPGQPLCYADLDGKPTTENIAAICKTLRPAGKSENWTLQLATA